MTSSDRKDERRHFSRIPFDARTTLRRADGREWHGALLDISLNGALLERPQDWDDGPRADLVLEILLTETARICMEVAVAHVEAHYLGLRCTHIDLDSIAHLRRLVELNLGDPELLNRELSALG